MNLNESQKQAVASWVAEGQKLSEIQNRLVAEFGARLTYMEVRFLVDDLKLKLTDPEPPKVAPPLPAPAQPAPAAENVVPETLPGAEVPAPGAGKVSVVVD